jgi:hypothetical protein
MRDIDERFSEILTCFGDEPRRSRSEVSNCQYDKFPRNPSQGFRVAVSLEEAYMDFDFQKARNSLHQLNNKVAQILAYAELMQLGLTGEKEKERIKLVIAGALECRQITASLMNDMPKTTPPGEN